MIYDHLDRQRPSHAFLGGRGDGFVVGFGMQRISKPKAFALLP
jgi:hypothetical protein